MDRTAGGNSLVEEVVVNTELVGVAETALGLEVSVSEVVALAARLFSNVSRTVSRFDEQR